VPSSPPPSSSSSSSPGLDLTRPEADAFQVHDATPRAASAMELELLARLLLAFTCTYPLPDKRQDVLRLLDRFLSVVLPHPSCAALAPQICACVQHLLCKRLEERSTKNFRVVLLCLSLIKDAMSSFLRRNLLTEASMLKMLIHDVYAHWGREVFRNAQAHEEHGLMSTPVSKVVKSLKKAGDENIDSVENEDEDARKDADSLLYEECMYLLYQSDSQQQMKSVLAQHKERFELLLNVRLNKMNTIVNDYQMRRKMLDAEHEQQLLGASLKEVHSQTTDYRLHTKPQLYSIVPFFVCCLFVVCLLCICCLFVCGLNSPSHVYSPMQINR
jgi:hypothetical protein